jgi:hypothetical protein
MVRDEPAPRSSSAGLARLRNHRAPFAGTYRFGPDRLTHYPYVHRTTMRSPALLLRAGALAAALPLLAACDGGGGTGPARLNPADVAGVYNLCALRFTPTNNILPEADLMLAVVDTTPPAGRPEATISIAGSSFDLVYTRASDAFLRQQQGSVSYGTSTITLNLPAESAVARELLLPRPLTLAFADGPQPSLTVQTQFSYFVDRGDYARARGSSEAGLAPTIGGSLTASLTAAPCP